MKYKNLIGFEPSKEMVGVKSKLHRHQFYTKFDLDALTHLAVMYFDNNNIKQLREEMWEEIDKNTVRVRTMTPIKNGVREGEKISVIWD